MVRFVCYVLVLLAIGNVIAGAVCFAARGEAVELGVDASAVLQAVDDQGSSANCFHVCIGGLAPC